LVVLVVDVTGTRVDRMDKWLIVRVACGVAVRHQERSGACRHVLAIREAVGKVLQLYRFDVALDGYAVSIIGAKDALDVVALCVVVQIDLDHVVVVHSASNCQHAPASRS
jgi:hypothetical protein